MKKVIEEYNLDNLREIVRNLEEENEHLKKLLKENNISIVARIVFNISKWKQRT